MIFILLNHLNQASKYNWLKYITIIFVLFILNFYRKNYSYFLINKNSYNK
jgi:hypothetical protein